MTDLERQWDELPVGPAPVDAILREARRTRTTRRRAALRRPLLGVVAVGAVAAAFVAGGVVTQPPPGPATPGEAGSGSGADAAPPGSDASPAAFFGELQAPDSCDDLLDHYVGRGLDLVSRYGWDGPDVYPQWYAFAEDESAEMALPAAPLSMSRDAQAYSAQVEGSHASGTGTNVQEAGVDEPDAVKTDGRLLVRLREAELTVYDLTGGPDEPVTELGSLDLGDLHDGEILLAGDRVVALGNDGTRARRSTNPYSYYSGSDLPSPQTRVLTVDISDPTSPALGQTVDYDAELVAARQHGDDVRLVLRKGLPDLDFERGAGAGAANRDVVESSTLDDWLPHVSVDGGEPTDLLDCDRVAVPRADLGLATMAVVGFSASSSDDGGTADALGLAGDAPLTYESAGHLYLAASGDQSMLCFDWCGLPPTTTAGFDGTTHVYDFALDGTGATYVGAGEVEGTVRDRWSMDEVDGVLRLAVGPSSETGSWNSIVTLRADGDELVEVGRLDRLGIGEDVKAVRWFDGLALLVTFRQVDPLYAVDLTDAARPRLLGELKIPGFSSYLHPLGPVRVLGLGTGPQPGGGSGAQAGLFLTRDLTDPRRVDVESYGRGTYARAGDDPRQFTWLPDQRVALTVVARGRTGWVSTLTLENGRMSSRMTRVEYGSDVDDVRLVPVSPPDAPAGPDADPDRRVVLVTGEDVAWFPLA
ncbi:hypothetical protein GCM10023340_12820 [Nocardioides marinquilinus]|uniref:Beta propeller domain-containing protein n=1 Tax=Nocardioides marinquilinus TaxID=1210400 RepID=A0ABP9PD90_9ACTN